MADVPPKNDSVPNGRTDGNEAKQETDGRKRVTNRNIQEKETLRWLYSKWKNVNSINDAFKLEQQINKSIHTFIIHAQGPCSVQAAENHLILMSPMVTFIILLAWCLKHI